MALREELWPWDSQPQQPAPLRAELQRYLSASIIGSSPIFDGCGTVTTAGGIGRVATTQGLAWRGDGTDNVAYATPGVDGSIDTSVDALFTFICVFRKIGASVDANHIAGYGSSGGSGGNTLFRIIGGSSADAIRLQFQTGSGNIIYNTDSSGASINDGRPHCAVITSPFTSGTDVLRYYIDGKAAGTVTRLVGLANTTFNRVSVGASIRGGTAISPGNFEVVAFVALRGVEMPGAWCLEASRLPSVWDSLFEPQRIWVPVSAGGSSVSLTVADATHAHTADGLVLASSTALSVADATHAHAADNITLVVGSVLTIAEASHAHTADSLTLTAASALAVADATHSHAADNITLSVAGATSLTVADALHSHAADALALTSAHALIVADATHSHTVDGLTLTAASVLAIQEALHAHAADATVLTMDSALAVAETLHAQAADNLVLGVAGTTNLVVADVAHAHSADVLVLTSAHALAIADAIHSHSVEGLTLSVASVLAIQEALHAHAAENLALETTGSAVLLLADSLHAHTSDGAALTVDAWLVAADAAHGHSADNVVFTFGGAIPTDTLPMMVPLQNSYMLVAPERSLMIVRV